MSRRFILRPWTSRLIAPQPRREVFHLIAVGKDCRQADDAALIGVLTTQEALNLNLVSNLAFAGTDHMAFVEHEQAHIVEQRRIVPQGEVELLGGRDYDVTLADGILVEAGHADAAVEGGNGFAERSEGTLKRGFGLRRQGTKRGHEHDAPPAGQTSQNGQFGDAGLPGTGRQ